MHFHVPIVLSVDVVIRSECISRQKTKTETEKKKRKVKQHAIEWTVNKCMI